MDDYKTCSADGCIPKQSLLILFRYMRRSSASSSNIVFCTTSGENFPFLLTLLILSWIESLLSVSDPLMVGNCLLLLWFQNCQRRRKFDYAMDFPPWVMHIDRHLLLSQFLLSIEFTGFFSLDPFHLSSKLWPCLNSATLWREELHVLQLLLNCCCNTLWVLKALLIDNPISSLAVIVSFFFNLLSWYNT